MDSYPEIAQLKGSLEKFNVTISSPTTPIRKDLFFVTVSIQDLTWEILVDDEHLDFSSQNKLMNWFLVLNSLELYWESEDILTWTKQLHIDPSERQFLSYYTSLANVYREIEAKIGKIDPCISAYDYNLRTGVVQALRNESC